MLCGYCRVSTYSQTASIEEQQRVLLATGCTKLFVEVVSSVARREQLQAALGWLRSGDTLVVTRVDRLARSTADLLAIINQLEAKEVSLRVLDWAGQTVETRTPTGRLMLTMTAAFAQFEREIGRDRARVGIEAAKLAGKYKGRQPLPAAKVAAVKALRASGKGASVIASEVGISRASVYRIVAEARQ